MAQIVVSNHLDIIPKFIPRIDTGYKDIVKQRTNKDLVANEQRETSS
jgi:hypothetical protein